MVYWTITSESGEWPVQMKVEARSADAAKAKIEAMIVADHYVITKVEAV